MKQATSILALSGLLSLANAHGYITTPSPRLPGSAMSSACGQQVYNNQAADRAGNIQGELQVASGQSDYDAEACGIWLCKGYQFADNTDNVQSYTAGEVVDFVVDIVAPHTGVANVSIVDTASNSVIGSSLIEWTDYASTATGVTEDETNFSITIPEDLGEQCTEAGACVIQWYWFAESIDQTYESCVDFTVGGSGSGGSSSSASTSVPTSTSSTSVPTSTASATTTTTTTTTTAVPTTLTTSVRPTTTSTTTTTEAEKTPTESSTPIATATSTGISIPKDGTAEEQLSWVESLLKALLARV
ncbi:chitin binding domain-containing protein [Aspergillus cavernicola]|uniref:Chitin binding domain-containing protein n=1 Tax=Aspergillus cavernicola TaxID=176166 RepID=A0ABR4I6M6_9EURO